MISVRAYIESHLRAGTAGVVPNLSRLSAQSGDLFTGGFSLLCERESWKRSFSMTGGLASRRPFLAFLRGCSMIASGPGNTRVVRPSSGSHQVGRLPAFAERWPHGQDECWRILLLGRWRLNKDLIGPVG